MLPSLFHFPRYHVQHSVFPSLLPSGRFLPLFFAQSRFPPSSSQPPHPLSSAQQPLSPTVVHPPTSSTFFHRATSSSPFHPTTSSTLLCPATSPTSSCPADSSTFFHPPTSSTFFYPPTSPTSSHFLPPSNLFHFLPPTNLFHFHPATSSTFFHPPTSLISFHPATSFTSFHQPTSPTSTQQPLSFSSPSNNLHPLLPSCLFSHDSNFKGTHLTNTDPVQYSHSLTMNMVNDNTTAKANTKTQALDKVKAHALAGFAPRGIPANAAGNPMASGAVLPGLIEPGHANYVDQGTDCGDEKPKCDCKLGTKKKTTAFKVAVLTGLAGTFFNRADSRALLTLIQSPILAAASSLPMLLPRARLFAPRLAPLRWATWLLLSPVVLRPSPLRPPSLFAPTARAPPTRLRRPPSAPRPSTARSPRPRT